MIAFICGYITLRNLGERNYKASDGGLLSILNAVVEAINMCCLLVTSVCSKMYVVKNQRLWQKLYEVEKELQQIDVMVNHTIVQNYVIIGTTFTIILHGTSSVLLIIFDERREGFLYYVAVGFYYHYTCMDYLLLSGHFIIYFFIINNMLAKITNSLSKTFLDHTYSRNSNRSGFLAIIQYHQQICELARQGNFVLSIQLVFVFVEIFSLLSKSMSLFSSTISIIKNDYGIIDIVHLLWTAVVLVTLVSFVAISSQCMDKVGIRLICHHKSQVAKG